MPLIEYPRCPRCHGELQIARLYSEGPTSRGIILTGDGSGWGGVLTAGNTGIVCPSCGTPLLVLQGRALLIAWLLMISAALVLGLVIFFLTQRFHFDENSQWSAALLLGALIVFSYPISNLVGYAKRFVQLRPLEEGEHAAFPLGGQFGDHEGLAAADGQRPALVEDARENRTAWCLLAAIGIGMVAGILLLFGTVKVPSLGSLETLSGSVVDAHRICSRSQCSVWMRLHSESGEIEVFQDDFTSGGLPVLRRGTATTVLIAPVPASHEFWEIRSGGVVLASYKEIAQAVNRHRRRLIDIGYLAAAAAIALLTYGIRLGIKGGFWRTSQ